MTAIDSHRGIALDDTSSSIVAITFTIMRLRASRIILVRTATTAIDVATILISRSTINAGICNTHHTAMNGDRSIMVRMSVLTTAIDRALNLRAKGFVAGFAYHNLRIINPCHVVLDSTWGGNVAS